MNLIASAADRDAPPNGSAHRGSLTRAADPRAAEKAAARRAIRAGLGTSAARRDAIDRALDRAIDALHSVETPSGRPERRSSPIVEITPHRLVLTAPLDR